MVSWELNCSQHFGQQPRRFLLVHGASAAQDVCATTLFKSSWPNYNTLSVHFSLHGGRTSGRTRCSSSPVWKRSSMSGDASVNSGEAQTTEQLWEAYFADPSQWWDNRIEKRNPRSPDFKHMVTRKALWIDGWSTPAWVKARLNKVTQGKLQSHAGCRSGDFKHTQHSNRLPKDKNGRRNPSSVSARELRQIVQGDDGSMHLQRTSTTNEAIAILKARLQQGATIDSYTYVEVLKRCLNEKDLTAAKQVHECIIKSGMDQNIYVANNLLSVYIRCGRLQDARRVFDALLAKDVITWNILIGGYAQHNHAKDAMDLFTQLHQEGVQADDITYLSILKACVSSSALKWGRQVHAYIRHGGLESDVRVGTALLKMYAKCGCMEEARQAFDSLTNRNLFSWNVMIGAYAESGRGDEAYQLYLQMNREGFQPDAITYMSILNACASAGALEWVKEVHRHVLGAGLEFDLRVTNAIVHMYAKSGSIDDARQVFDGMNERDVITWSVMIGGLAQYGRGREAYEFFLQMQREGCLPNAITYMSILNSCASAGALEWVKEVHSHVRDSGYESNLGVANALVNMYAKSGSIEDARLVFDRMSKRDVISWNAMIGAYAESGRGVEAYELYLQMNRGGFQPDAVTYMSILNSCASAGALEWVKEVHRHIRDAGLESDVRVANALVNMYSKSGSIDEARLLFDLMEERDVITWTAMIGAYAESGRGVEAYELYVEMRRVGFQPDAVTYMSILNSCACAGALEWVKEVHRHALGAGYESNLGVANALVNAYAKRGSIEDAQLVFDRMEDRDVTSWNTMIGAYAQSSCSEEAYELYLQMRREGLQGDVITYMGVLNACARAGTLETGEEVHRHVQETGFESDWRVASALVHMYVKCGRIDDARLVFNRIEVRDVITWTVMIAAYAENGRGNDAYQLYLQMRREGGVPNGITYMSILNACANFGALEWGKEVHRHVRDAGLESDVRVANALVHMYAKSSSIDNARQVFDRMDERDVITWTAIICAYAGSGRGDEAYEFYLQMQREGFQPDAVTYMSILNSCASAGALEWVKEVHSHVRDSGYESNLGVANALVNMYAKSGSIEDARLVFDRMSKRDVISWNAMIGAYAESGRGVEAYELYLQMNRGGFQPDAVTYMSILNSCASAGALEWVKEVHRHIRDAGLESDVRVATALVNMYSKSGSIDEARLLFDLMEERDVITWSIMMGGLAQHGCGHDALDLFRKMNADGIRPDGYSFVAVLSACSHAGLVDEGRQLFFSMSQDYGIEPTLWHYACMVDLLGRAGQLEDAKVFIGNMPVNPDKATWGALLGACRTYGNVELGEYAAKEVLKLDPKGASPYVLLSNIYASADKWEEVSVVRTMMQERGIRKEPGRSWIEVDNKIHDFVVGDRSHPEATEIYAELNMLIERIKAEGYIPDTRLVLKNIDEEDKELALCSHSEKLAIAYGLMRVPHGEPIRVYKNLRVCSDCHAATKFISKVTGREIVARDANRFHHFRDGVCSCGDYW